MSSEPAPVEVTNTEPMPVTLARPSDTPEQTTARSVASSARVDAAILRTEDQRRISGMWERTQQVIALSVVETALLVATLLVIFNANQGNDATSGVAFVFLASVANLVIGFYFGRTNHQRVGGVSTDAEENVGR